MDGVLSMGSSIAACSSEPLNIQNESPAMTTSAPAPIPRTLGLPNSEPPELAGAGFAAGVIFFSLADFLKEEIDFPTDETMPVMVSVKLVSSLPNASAKPASTGESASSLFGMIVAAGLAAGDALSSLGSGGFVALGACLGSGSFSALGGDLSSGSFFALGAGLGSCGMSALGAGADSLGAGFLTSGLGCALGCGFRCGAAFACGAVVPGTMNAVSGASR